MPGMRLKSAKNVKLLARILASFFLLPPAISSFPPLPFSFSPPLPFFSSPVPSPPEAFLTSLLPSHGDDAHAPLTVMCIIVVTQADHISYRELKSL